MAGVLSCAALWCATVHAQRAPNPWVDGPDAPLPEAGFDTSAPREVGASAEPIVTAPTPPAAVRAPLLLTPLPQVNSARLRTTLLREAITAAGALSITNGVDAVPGVWLLHSQAGAAQWVTRGLRDADAAVQLDGVPLLLLGGLLPALEVVTLDGSARLRFEHGPRVITHSASASGGVLDIDTLPAPTDMQDTLHYDGVVAAGYGGADLEKGVLAVAQAGKGRARIVLHGSLINREDQRQGRVFAPLFEAESFTAPHAGLLARSGGSAGSAGIAIAVSPSPSMTVFQAWHSARAAFVPYPALCQGSDDNGRAVDCVHTLERGIDAWVAGADGVVDVGGARVAWVPRFSLQRAVDNAQRAGSALSQVQTDNDSAVRGSASFDTTATLPTLSWWDAWVPQLHVGIDASRDIVSSAAYTRSLSARDAEPAGLGISEPSRARLIDGAQFTASSVRAQIGVDGEVVDVSVAARLVASALDAPAVAQRTVAMHRVALSPQAEGTVQFTPWSTLGVFFTLVHTEHGADLGTLRGPDFGAAVMVPPSDTDAVFVDNSAELGVRTSWAYLQGEAVVWGSTRSGALVLAALPGDALGRAQWVRGGIEQHAGMEARARVLFPERSGVSLSTTLAAAAASHSAGDLDTPLSALTGDAPLAGVLNPTATALLSYEPPAWTFVGGFVRARAILPQARLARSEEHDRALCPQLPSDDERAAGAVRTQPCSGADGALVLDVGAHVQLGRVRLDVVGENLLDREARVRDEAIGSGGVAVRALVAVKL